MSECILAVSWSAVMEASLCDERLDPVMRDESDVSSNTGCDNVSTNHLIHSCSELLAN